jgi:hypothetical protein
MKPIFHLLVLGAIAVFAFVLPAEAQIPRTLSYQGVLTDTLGNPRPDGIVTFTFRLYDTPTGGTAIWTEIKDLQVRRGLFFTALGDVTPFGAGVRFDRPYWLGVKPGSEPELSPRIPLTSVGYSFSAIKSDTAQYALTAPQQTYVDSARIAGTISDNAITTQKILDSTITGADISSTAALNIASLTTTGNVGIGTTSPNEQLEITGNLRLPATSASAGVIKSDTSRFIHNFGTNNFFAGVNAGNLTMTGFGRNTGVGVNALFSNTTGYYNTANGLNALYSNTEGVSNTANGYQALYSNTTGNANTANGVNALYSNTTGAGNTANGYDALRSNTTGNANTANGVNALYSNTTGFINTALGYSAGSNITSGSNNIAIGYNAQVPTATADNQIRLGNTSITYAGIQVAWSVTSDRRYKENIQPLNLGLGFISKLNPVSYYRKADEKQRTEYGLIAQEVEQVLKDCGVENPGMLTITDKGMYELRYNDLLAPMIKAIQELNNNNKELTAKSEELRAENKELKTKNQELAERLSTLEAMVKSLVEQRQDGEKKSIGELR